MTYSYYSCRALLFAGMIAAAILAAVPGVAQIAGPDPAVLNAVVRLEAEAPPDARSARNLGTKREGNGVVIDDTGLVVTIGYLILEAMSVIVYDAANLPVPAEVVGYDHETGFGLVQARRPLGAKPLALGDSNALKVRDRALVAGHGGAMGAIGAFVVSRREFAGWWEYLLEEAIFTAPAHPNWGGAALIGMDGRLYGIGSLFIADSMPGERPIAGNMFVPINLLKPIMADMMSDGRPAGPRRPWLGMSTGEAHGRLMVTAVSNDGPAERAGLKSGDMIVGVGDQKVSSVAQLYRTIWAQGEAGVEVPLRVVRDGAPYEIAVRSADRYKYLRFRPSY